MTNEDLASLAPANDREAFRDPWAPQLRNPATRRRVLQALRFDDDDQRRRAIRLVAIEVYRTRDRALFDLLLEHLLVESNPYNIETGMEYLFTGFGVRIVQPAASWFAPLPQEPFRTLADHSRGEVRAAAINAMRFCEQTDLEPIYLKAAAGRHWRSVLAGGYGLARLQTPGARAALIDLLEHHDTDVRVGLIQTFARIAGRDGLPVIRTLAAKPRWRRQQPLIFDILSEFGDPADVPAAARRTLKLYKGEVLSQELLGPLCILAANPDASDTRRVIERLRADPERLPDDIRHWLDEAFPDGPSIAPDPPPFDPRLADEAHRAIAAARARQDMPAARTIASRLKAVGYAPSLFRASSVVAPSQRAWRHELDYALPVIAVENLFVAPFDGRWQVVDHARYTARFGTLASSSPYDEPWFTD